jgi:hypothetical protein
MLAIVTPMRVCRRAGVYSTSFPPKGDGATLSRSVYLAPDSVVEREGLDEFLGAGRGSASVAVSGGRGTEDVADWSELDAYAQHYGMQDTPAPSGDSEGDLWVPGEIARVTTQFRRRHLSHVPLALIHEFLTELNATWRRRLNAVLAATKEK